MTVIDNSHCKTLISGSDDPIVEPLGKKFKDSEINLWISFSAFKKVKSKKQFTNLCLNMKKIKFLKLLSASDMFCAKNENGNTAGVDMGGPLVVESGHRYELVGVTTGIRYIHRLVWPQQTPIQLGKISFIIFLLLVD